MGICPPDCCQRKLEMSVDMTFSFLNKEYEDAHEKIVDVVDEEDKKVEDAEAEEKEVEYGRKFNISENYSNQFKHYQATNEKEDTFDDIESAEEDEDEEEDDEQDQDEEGSEEEVSEEDVSDESRSDDVSDESRCEEEETKSPQFGKRMFSDLYSPVDQEKLEEPVVKKQKFEMSEILSAPV